MRRGTTPTHTFVLAVDAAVVRKVRVLYSQNGKVVLTRDDADLEGNVATVKLTQEETLQFTGGSRVEIQVRLLTLGGDALASDIISVPVDRLLESEVFA